MKYKTVLYSKPFADTLTENKKGNGRFFRLLRGNQNMLNHLNSHCFVFLNRNSILFKKILKIWCLYNTKIYNTKRITKQYKSSKNFCILHKTTQKRKETFVFVQNNKKVPENFCILYK